jgi:hypothetical protein
MRSVLGGREVRRRIRRSGMRGARVKALRRDFKRLFGRSPETITRIPHEGTVNEFRRFTRLHRKAVAK